MGLFVKDDPEYDESKRMTGFNRYKQLLSFYAGHWTVLNIIAVISAVPLAAFIIFSIMEKSILLMIPLSFAGGMIAGPFIAAIFDSIQRALRDDKEYRWNNFKKGMKQNSKSSLITGGILGLITGSYSFMFYMISCSALKPTKITILLIAFSFIVFWEFFILYWAQMVLFYQSFWIRLRNIVLFTAKHLWKMLLISILAIIYIFIIVALFPMSLIIIPFIGIWYILFLSQIIIYKELDEDFKIEELYRKNKTEKTEDNN